MTVLRLNCSFLERFPVQKQMVVEWRSLSFSTAILIKMLIVCHYTGGDASLQLHNSAFMIQS